MVDCVGPDGKTACGGGEEDLDKMMLFDDICTPRFSSPIAKGAYDDGRSSTSRPLSSELDPPVVDPYGILEVRRDATADELRDAYRRLALLHHPNRVEHDGGRGGGDRDDGSLREWRFGVVSACYETLSHLGHRRRYDAMTRTRTGGEAVNDNGGGGRGGMEGEGRSFRGICGATVASPGASSFAPPPHNRRVCPNRCTGPTEDGRPETPRHLLGGETGVSGRGIGMGPCPAFPSIPAASTSGSSSEVALVHHKMARAVFDGWDHGDYQDEDFFLHPLEFDANEHLLLRSPQAARGRQRRRRRGFFHPDTSEDDDDRTVPDIHYTARETESLLGGPLSLIHRARNHEPLTDPYVVFRDVFESDIFRRRGGVAGREEGEEGRQDCRPPHLVLPHLGPEDLRMAAEGLKPRSTPRSSTAFVDGGEGDDGDDGDGNGGSSGEESAGGGAMVQGLVLAIPSSSHDDRQQQQQQRCHHQSGESSAGSAMAPSPLTSSVHSGADARSGGSAARIESSSLTAGGMTTLSNTSTVRTTERASGDGRNRMVRTEIITVDPRSGRRRTVVRVTREDAADDERGCEGTLDEGGGREIGSVVGKEEEQCNVCRGGELRGCPSCQKDLTSSISSRMGTTKSRSKTTRSPLKEKCKELALLFLCCGPMVP